MWILTEEGKEVWTGEGTGQVLVAARKRMIQKVKDEVRSEIAEEMWEAKLDERAQEQRERKKKERLAKEKQRQVKEKQRQLEKKQRLAKEKAEEKRRQKALLYNGKGMLSIWLPVKFKCCPACGAVMQHIEVRLGVFCSAHVTYGCNGDRATQVHVAFSSRLSKGALVPSKEILGVEITQRCKKLETLVTKAALNLLVESPRKEKVK